MPPPSRAGFPADPRTARQPPLQLALREQRGRDGSVQQGMAAGDHHHAGCLSKDGGLNRALTLCQIARTAAAAWPTGQLEGPNGPPKRDVGPQRPRTPQDKAEETKQLANGTEVSAYDNREGSDEQPAHAAYLARPATSAWLRGRA